jgi:prophage maintenance system killer protein
LKSEPDEVVIYNAEDGTPRIEVMLKEDTVWLTQAQMAKLFDTTPQNITMHLKNVFSEEELEEQATCKDFLQVRQEGQRTIRRRQLHYNLDSIISIGYRVKSQRATQFRKWATNVLRDHLVQGYTFNEHRLRQSEERYTELQQAVKLMARAGQLDVVSGSEAKGILDVLRQYAFALDTLDKYDHQSLEVSKIKPAQLWKLTYPEAIREIIEWRKAQNAGSLFGNEKDDSFKSSLESIYQTFDGIDLYPSIDEKAAHLLYFIVKNHSFTDGNKRIAAGLFVYFLARNNRLYHEDGRKIIGDNALVAITIMIAESKSSEKETMIKLIAHLIDQSE